MGDAPAQRSGCAARVLIADDHALVREGLRAVLEGEAGMEVVGEAEDGLEAVEACRAPPGRGLDGREDAQGGRAGGHQAIKASTPQVSVVTMHENPDYLLEAVRAGAAGYVLKDSRGERIAEAVRRTVAGESPLEEGLAMRLLGRLAGRGASDLRGAGRGPGDRGWYVAHDYGG